MPRRSAESELDFQPRTILDCATQAIEGALLWLPGLAKTLASVELATLRRRCDLSTATYGTDRARSCNPRLARNVLVEFVPPFAEAADTTIIVEHPFARR